MADHADNEGGGGGGGDVYVYRGGLAPDHVTHVRIDKSVEVIDDLAFCYCERRLVKVETHDRIRKVGERAFHGCRSLRSIDLRSVVKIDMQAFDGCKNLTNVEFGDKLETLGTHSFYGCTSLQRLKLPSIITIHWEAFMYCSALSSIEFSERLETIELNAFYGCERLQRIAIPLKRDLFLSDNQVLHRGQFHNRDQLKTVDLVGGAHNKTVASLHMESWRTEIKEEINRINQDLPNIDRQQNTEEIRHWMDSVIDKMDHYKAEHHRYVKDAVTLLELALWKAKLDEIDETAAEGRTKKVKLDAESVRKEKRVTCGADLVIRNILPFLQLE